VAHFVSELPKCLLSASVQRSALFDEAFSEEGEGAEFGLLTRILYRVGRAQGVAANARSHMPFHPLFTPASSP
jgi:hypothetical protein